MTLHIMVDKHDRVWHAQVWDCVCISCCTCFASLFLSSEAGLISVMRMHALLNSESGVEDSHQEYFASCCGLSKARDAMEMA